MIKKPGVYIFLLSSLSCLCFAQAFGEYSFIELSAETIDEKSLSDNLKLEKVIEDLISIDPPSSDEIHQLPDGIVQEKDEQIEISQEVVLDQTPHDQAAAEPEPSCGRSARPMRITARHIESNGIGYNQGYTTIEGFFAPMRFLGECWLPFIDLRGHLFNNGKWGANGGFGVRYLASSRIWGMNAYYDFRETSREHYNQASVGFESLGRVWDFRLNGYLPFGKKQSSIWDTKFDRFDGHRAILSSKYEFAMRGVNAEAGYHWNKYPKYPMYAGLGPYYLEGKGKNAWGAQLRVALDVGEYFRFEGNTSYDNVFKWIGQGQVSLNIPFGPKRKVQQKKGRTCSQELALAARMLQPVDRFEIIPVDKKHKKTIAINPLTGQPYTFWFVNNTSHSNGTFESPFSNLSDAQNASLASDVIYVYPGDGTSNGMNNGIVLKDNQRLWGSGIDQLLPTTLGSVTVPAESATLPIINNIIVGTHATVVLANANEISGMHVTSTGGGGVGIGGGVGMPGITDTNIHNNFFSADNGAIELFDCNGTLLIKNNIIENCNFGIVCDLGVVRSRSILIANNRLSNLGSSGVSIAASAGNMNYCILDNLISNTNGAGVAFTIVSAGVELSLCGIIAGNEISNTNGAPSIDINNEGGPHSVEVFDNTATNSMGFVANDFVGTFCLGLRGNSDSGGYSLRRGSETFNLESPNGALSGVQSMNVGLISTTGSITFVPPGTCQCGTACDLGSD